MAGGVSDSELVVSNTAFLLVGQVVTGALSLLLVIALGRSFLSLGLGLYSAAIALSGILLQLFDLGIPTYAVREIARKKEATRDYLSAIIGLRVTLSAVMVAAAVITLFVMAFFSKITPETTTIFLLAITGTALSFLAEPLRIVLLAHERHHYYAATSIMERLVFVVFGLAMIASGRGIALVMLGFVLSSLASLLVNSVLVWKRFSSFSIRVDLPEWKSLVRNGFPFWLSNLIMTTYFKVDTLLLSLLKGFTATGLYNAASKMTDLLTFIPLAVATAFYPTLSRLHRGNSGSALGIFYKKAFSYLVIIALPMAVLFSLTAGRLMLVYKSSEYAPAAGVLQIIAWAEAFIFVNYLMGYLLNSIDRQRLFTISAGICAGFNILLNLLLIPTFGYMGAAAAALVTQLAQAIALFRLCSKSGYGLDLPRLVYKPIIAAAVMALAILLLEPFHLALVVAAAALAYLGTLIIIKGVGKGDLEIIKGLIRRMATAGR